MRWLGADARVGFACVVGEHTAASHSFPCGLHGGRRCLATQVHPVRVEIRVTELPPEPGLYGKVWVCERAEPCRHHSAVRSHCRSQRLWPVVAPCRWRAAVRGRCSCGLWWQDPVSDVVLGINSVSTDEASTRPSHSGKVKNMKRTIGLMCGGLGLALVTASVAQTVGAQSTCTRGRQSCATSCGVFSGECLPFAPRSKSVNCNPNSVFNGGGACANKLKYTLVLLDCGTPAGTCNFTKVSGC